MMTLQVLLLAVVGIQGDTRPKDDRLTVVVQGCLQGSTLRVTDADTSGVSVDTYKLKLSKALKSALKEHEGHEEELSGLLVPSNKRMGGTKTKTVGSGKTKITIGAEEQRLDNTADIPELEVQSFRHVAPVCNR
jgi:hypothetical protein